MIKQEINSCVRENLIRLRNEYGMTQDNLVARMQIYGSTMSRSHYSLIELGRRRISVAELFVIKNIYDIDFDEFFRELEIKEVLDE